MKSERQLVGICTVVIGLLMSVPSWAQSKILVHNKQELLTALKNAKSGQVVYVADTAKINLTGEQTIIIHTNITLASGGKKGGKGGALLYTTKNGTSPLFRMSHRDGRITGLRIKGPDMGIYANGVNHFAGKSAIDRKKNRLKYYKQNMYSVPLSQGIRVTAPRTQIDHCEIYGWTHAGVMIQKGGEAKIVANNIHHNRRFGLGYGIDLDQGKAIIHDNIFDYNRHSIAGTGRPGTSYEAYDNIFYQHHKNWAVDMHGGKDRKDGTDIAGTSVKVYDNTFYINPIPGKALGVVIRGVPQKEAVIKGNTFYILKDKRASKAVKTLSATAQKNTPASSLVIEQKNAKGKMTLKNNKVIFK